MEVLIDKKLYKGEPEDFFKFCKGRYGEQAAKVIDRRLSNARAAKNLAVLMQQGFPGRWHWLSGATRKHQISADLDKMNRLIFEPIEEVAIFMSREGNGNLDNQKVEGIVFLEITDTHHE